MLPLRSSLNSCRLFVLNQSLVCDKLNSIRNFARRIWSRLDRLDSGKDGLLIDVRHLVGRLCGHQRQVECLLLVLVDEVGVDSC